MEKSIHSWELGDQGEINNCFKIHIDGLALGPDLLMLFTAILSTHTHTRTSGYM